MNNMDATYTEPPKLQELVEMAKGKDAEGVYDLIENTTTICKVLQTKEQIFNTTVYSAVSSICLGVGLSMGEPSLAPLFVDNVQHLFRLKNVKHLCDQCLTFEIT